jgi:hypothetical protein
MALRLLKGGKSLFPKKEHPPKVGKVEHNFTEDEEVEDTLTGRPMPPEKQCKRVGVMDRKYIDTTGIFWDETLLMLTEDVLYFSRAEERLVLDFIHTKDLKECEVREDEDGDDNTIEVIFRTKDDCRNCGRSYIFRTNPKDAEEWEELTDATFERAHKELHDADMLAKYGHSNFEMIRAKTKIMIETPLWQFMCAACICFGFLCDVGRAQMLVEDGSNTAKMFFSLDCAVTVCFALELLINIFALSENCFRLFYINPGNWFDVVLVAVLVVDLIQEATTGTTSPPVKQIRIIKVTKIFRHIKHLAALNRLVNSIGFCVIPMSMAFMILLVVTLVYSILGVYLFGARSPVYFNDLKSALLAMMRVSTGDYSLIYELFDVSHFDKNGNPCIEGRRKSAGGSDTGDDSQAFCGIVITDPAIAFFFVTYILMANVLLLNVVVAVLLDEFLANVEREKGAADREVEALLAKQRVTGVLDPVTSNLTSFQNLEDLSRKIDNIFNQLDSDGGGELSFEEFKAGLKGIPGIAKIHMTADDFDIITEKGKHLGEQGTFNLEQFHRMMDTELNLYIFRGLCNVLKESSNVEFKTIVLMLKMIEKNIQTRIDKICISNGREGEYRSESLPRKEDFDLRNEVQTIKEKLQEMQESQKEALDRQDEKLSRLVVLALRHSEKGDCGDVNAYGRGESRRLGGEEGRGVSKDARRRMRAYEYEADCVDASSTATLGLDEAHALDLAMHAAMELTAAVQGRAALQLARKQAPAPRPGRRKEEEHPGRKESMRRGSLSREGRRSAPDTSQRLPHVLPSQVPWDRTHSERVANRENRRKDGKSKEMTARSTGSVAANSQLACELMFAERGAIAGPNGLLLLRPDSNIGPYAPTMPRAHSNA